LHRNWRHTPHRNISDIYLTCFFSVKDKSHFNLLISL
jgi:hypothetical protein